MNIIDQVLHTEEGREALARAMTDLFRVAANKPIEKLSETDAWSDDAYAYDWESDE